MIENDGFYVCMFFLRYVEWKCPRLNVGELLRNTYICNLLPRATSFATLLLVLT